MRNFFKSLCCGVSLVLLPSCGGDNAQDSLSTERPVNENNLKDIFPNGQTLEVLGEGYWWSEGPVWIKGQGNKAGYLLFTDVPQNIMFRWSEDAGVTEFLNPSGKADVDGANGLYPYGDDAILLADHGNRALYRFDLVNKTKSALAETYEGKRLNSPNDMVVRSDGTIYFTDPPYGLKGQDADPLKELNFNGVYMLTADGRLSIIDRMLTRPNGIVLSPDETSLIVANSDAKDAKWIRYNLDAQGLPTSRSVMDNVTTLIGDDNPGLPDGMVVAQTGHVFATGPGGIFIFNPDGSRLGRLDIPRATANVTFGGPLGDTLYITSKDKLLRIKTGLKGLGH